MSLFESFEDTLIINGIQVPVTIEVIVEEDDCYEQDANETLPAGMFAAWVKVRALAIGQTGIDALGGCYLHCNNMFNSEPFNADVNEVVTDNGMVANAIADLEATIIARANELKPFATNGGAQ